MRDALMTILAVHELLELFRSSFDSAPPHIAQQVDDISGMLKEMAYELHNNNKS